MKIKSFLRKLAISITVLCSLLLAHLIYALPIDSFSTPADIFVFKHQRVIAVLIVFSCALWGLIKFWDFLGKDYFGNLQKLLDEYNKNR